MPPRESEARKTAPYLADFRHRLEVVRKRLDLSVHAFALYCGVPNTAMRNYLNGRSLPSIENLDAIARATNTSIQWLVRGTGEAWVLDSTALQQVVEAVLSAELKGQLPPDKVARIAEHVSSATPLLYQAFTVGSYKGVLGVEEVLQLAREMARIGDDGMPRGASGAA